MGDGRRADGWCWGRDDSGRKDMALTGGCGYMMGDVDGKRSCTECLGPRASSEFCRRALEPPTCGLHNSTITALTTMALRNGV